MIKLKRETRMLILLTEQEIGILTKHPNSLDDYLEEVMTALKANIIIIMEARIAMMTNTAETMTEAMTPGLNSSRSIYGSGYNRDDDYRGSGTTRKTNMIDMMFS